MRHADSGEYLQAPVVVTTDTHWSGFRPDRLRSLAA
jgi:glutaredoxin-like protein NrdH